MKKFLLLVMLIVISTIIGYTQNIIISQYYEGTGNNKWIEISNVGNETIDLTSPQLYLCLFSNSSADDPANSSPTNKLTLSDSILPGEVKVFKKSSATTPTYASGTNATVCNFNGDDLIIITTSNSSSTGVAWNNRIDVIGNGSTWGKNKSFYRNPNIISPNTTYTTSEWTEKTNSDVDNATSDKPEYIGTVLFKGLWKKSATNSDWNTSTNWGDENTPTSSVTVIIPSGASNYPSVSGDATTPSECNNITIASGASLTIPTGKALSVHGNFINNSTAANVVVESNNSGNGSLIVNGTVTGNATVKRYFQGYNAGADNGWHLIGSPVNNMTISGSDFEPGTDDDLYQWNESSNTWENYKQNHFTTFENGRGYLCAFSSDKTASFVGTLNTGDITVTGLSHDDKGWHIIGNPYSSALVWNNGNWTLTNVGGTCQVWDEDKPGYEVINANGIIPSTNGFFVEVNSGTTGSVTIPASAKTHDATNNYKKSTADEFDETLVLRVINEENNYYDLVRIGFRDDATEGWDIAFDAHKLFGPETAPQLWAVLNSEDFSQNFLPYVYEPYEVPVHFKAGKNSTFKITAEGLDSFEGNANIMLEDLLTGTTVDLNEQQTYTFTGNADDNQNRFVLHFYNVTSIDETPESNEAYIYSFNDRIYIKFNKATTSHCNINVYNTLGQLVYSNSYKPEKLISFNLNKGRGMYVVRVKTDKGISVKKVIVE